MKRWPVILWLAAFVSLCSVAKTKGLGDLGNLGDLGSILGNISKQVERVAPLVVDNDQLGLLFAQGVEKQHGIDSNPQRETRVQQIGSKILTANHIGGKYDFAVLATHDFNACSIYGGHIRVNEGLLYDTQNNDAEAAFAIAHEIAHQSLGHNRETVNNFKVTYALELANISQKMPQLLTAGANAVLAKRSRENESAADFEALKYMAQAGYKPTGAIAMARRIEAEHKIAQRNAGNQSLLAQRFSAIFDTHPEPAKRAEMAEDFYFQQKYGTTFKAIAGASTGSGCYYEGSTFIVAHPSWWESELGVLKPISGVAIFNPSPACSEEEDVRFFLKVCNDHLVAVTCDNDSHDFLEFIDVPEKGTDTHFTFIQGDEANQQKLIAAIRAGQTYASRVGMEIHNMNFFIGRSYQKVNYPHLTFTLTYRDMPLDLSDGIIVYRDGEKLGRFRAQTLGIHEARFTIDDKDAPTGNRWYVLRVTKELITSPITFNVTHNRRDTLNPGGSSSWQKGIIHYHSFYSDGHSKSIQEIWDSGRKEGVGFVFMTDHADRLKASGDHAYSRYADDCQRASRAMLPGIEYSLRSVKGTNHILVLDPGGYKNYEEVNEETFFYGSGNPNQVCIIRDQFHLGDDHSQDEMEKDATFNYARADATLKLWIKGSPFKDPILWINRHEIGRVTTTDNKWHLFTFRVPAEYLNNGKNLFHIESFIPDRFHTFDDCEVKDVWIYR